ncbi:MAG: ribonuclease P protein component [Gammaproteobacteria bacterium]|nr:ribonuclease P protein component [Gammaproteobacteria bacterium]
MGATRTTRHRPAERQLKSPTLARGRHFVIYTSSKTLAHSPKLRIIIPKFCCKKAVRRNLLRRLVKVYGWQNTSKWTDEFFQRSMLVVRLYIPIDSKHFQSAQSMVLKNYLHQEINHLFTQIYHAK